MRIAVLGLALCAAPVRADTPDAPLSAAIEAARLDVKQAMADVNEWREQIGRMRPPLADRLHGLEREVADLRQEVRRLRLEEERGEQAKRARAADMRRAEEAASFAHTLLSEYRRAMETRAGTAEIQALAEPARQTDALLADPDPVAVLPQAAKRLLALAEEWNEARLGGRRFAGMALDADGYEHDGHFLQWGPATYFAGRDRQAAGLAATRLDSMLPGIEPILSSAAQRGLYDALAGADAHLPVDPTGGDALKLRAARPSFFAHIAQGGVVMIPILALGIVAFGLIVIKARQMKRFRVGDISGIRDVLHCLERNDEPAALARADTMGVPFGALMRAGVRYRHAPREHIEEILHERLLSHMPDLEKHLGTIAALGGIAPLLGLLGTVTGIMRTFQLVTVFGAGDAKLLSGGISEALVTTEFGLIIAIPALLAHALFARRIRTMVGAMEYGMTVFANELTVSKEPSCANS